MAENLQATDPFAQDHLEQDGFLKNAVSHFPKKQNLAVIGLLFVGLFLLAVGAGLMLFKGSTPNDDIKILEGSSEAAVGEIIVHVDGAVKLPGVYRLKSGSRVNDAIASAGGLTQAVDSSEINLAAKITDGQKLHIAAVGETSSTSAGGTGTTKSTVGSTPSNQISINSASQAQLESLPAVGPVMAQKIINGRPYNSIDELVSKKVVSKSTFEKIKDLISY